MRPSYGTLGSKVKVITNHFRVDLKENQAIFQYDVRIFEKDGALVDKMPGVKARRIMGEALKTDAETAQMAYAYDGWKNLYTVDKRPFGE